jgi:hypothetical protein
MPPNQIIVEKLLPSNIQCQVPAHCSAVLEGSELACGLIARAKFALAPKVMLVVRESAITPARANQRLFSAEIMIRSSKLFLPSGVLIANDSSRNSSTSKSTGLESTMLMRESSQSQSKSLPMKLRGS